MRVRHSVIAAALSLAVLGGAIGVASKILIDRFDAIELAQAADKATQAVRALEADLNQLALSTRDYAEWDDAQAFVTTRDPEFLSANFSFASLDGMQVDRLAILDRDGSVLYAAQSSPATNSLEPGLPKEFLESVRSLQPQIDALREHSSLHRVMRTPEGLLAFSFIEISRSDHSERTGAAMFFGRFLAADEITRMQRTSQLPAQLRTMPADIQRIDHDADTFAHAVNRNHISATALLRDWQGAPFAAVSVDGTRDIGGLGRRTTAWLMGAISMLILACCGSFLFMLRRVRLQWQQTEALRARQERILASLDECIALVEPASGRLVEVNAALLRTLDYTRDELPHLALQTLFVDIDPDVLASSPLESLGLRNCRLRARDGRLVACEINVTHLCEQNPPLICIAARDMTQRHLDEQRLQENQARLAHQSEHDALTGLPNRQYLQTRLPELLHQVSVDEQSLAMLYIDIDHFKNINDSKGHGFGDEILKIVARRLRADTSADDIVLRTGGDELVVVAPLQGGAAAMKSLALRLLTLFRSPIVHDGETLTLTASIGGALYPQDGLDGEVLLKHADIALYRAKEHGRNCFQAFVSDMNVQLSEHVVLEQALRRAIGTAQIQIAYQPVVDLHTGLLVSFEALARWHHPEMGMVPPGRFIPVAERSGLIVGLGEQIVHDVMKQLREWQDAGMTLAPVAINVAPVQLDRTEFSTFVHETAMNFDIDPRLVAFEVTESDLLKNSSKSIVMIDTLRHAGSRVYIDDFGTGFSNLSYLKTLPVDAVKIDQSFVRSIGTDASDAAIVASIIAVARQLRLDTIAEGVETAEHAERLRQLGCMYGQGYYFSKPMPAEQCRALLQQLGAARRLTETVKTRAFGQAVA